ncbi:MAG: hypothetical protein DRH56_07540 [Deltaproteobacteria bacterium]|nr:MAG: hypothetical protein DRH56_07540 [Deltaproteobacteria bacterium]
MTDVPGRKSGSREDENRCPGCGCLNRPGNRFCTRCGARLIDDGTAGHHPRLIPLGGDRRGPLLLMDNRNTLGRGLSNSVVVGDPQVSKRHAEIGRDDEGKYWIRDLGSRNGVFLNGGKVTGPRRLRDGDLVKLGSTILRFETSGSGPPGDR